MGLVGAGSWSSGVSRLIGLDEVAATRLGQAGQLSTAVVIAGSSCRVGNRRPQHGDDHD
jgi:hypothetical protein